MNDCPMKSGMIEKLSKKYRTPMQVQKFLRGLEYNREPVRPTLKSAEKALRLGRAHCFEAAFIAAALLEKNGYSPLVMSFESQDGLDHVIFVFQAKSGPMKGRWGSVARSRDEGLHGRPAIFRSLRDLAWSYFDPYVDGAGRITAYQIAHLDICGVDWRRSSKDVWPAEKYLLELPHVKLSSSNKRYKELKRLYLKRGPMPRKEFWW